MLLKNSKPISCMSRKTYYSTKKTLFPELGKLEDVTTQIKIAFLEEIVGINEIDFDNVPTALIDYYIDLKIKNLI